MPISLEKYREPAGFEWSVLPPLPINGLSGPHVESAEHYLCRLAWTVGVSGQEICRLREPSGVASGHNIGSSRGICGPGPNFLRRIYRLEQLTGVDTIRCGTFAVINDAISNVGVNRDTTSRRWCPRCYYEWDSSTSWEPLSWLVELKSDCSLHGCLLESRCHHCGAEQPFGRNYSERRNCRKCAARLAGAGRFPARDERSRWVDGNIDSLIAMCSVPGQASIQRRAVAVYVEGLIEQFDGKCIHSYSRNAVMQARQCRKGHKITLRALLNLCALQGVPLVDMLQAPRSSSSPALINLLENFRAIEIEDRRHRTRVSAYEKCVRTVLDQCAEDYLPSMKFILHALRMNRELARELSVNAYEDYEAAYRAQGAYSSTIHRARAFTLALRLFDDSSVRHSKLRGVVTGAQIIESATDVPRDVALRVAKSARIYWDALVQAKLDIVDGRRERGVR